MPARQALLRRPPEGNAVRVARRRYPVVLRSDQPVGQRRRSRRCTAPGARGGSRTDGRRSRGSRAPGVDRRTSRPVSGSRRAPGQRRGHGSGWIPVGRRDADERRCPQHHLRLRADRTVELVFNGVACPNGPAFRLTAALLSRRHGGADDSARPARRRRSHLRIQHLRRHHRRPARRDDGRHRRMRIGRAVGCRPVHRYDPTGRLGDLAARRRSADVVCMADVGELASLSSSPGAAYWCWAGPVEGDGAISVDADIELSSVRPSPGRELSPDRVGSAPGRPGPSPARKLVSRPRNRVVARASRSGCSGRTRVRAPSMTTTRASGWPPQHVARRREASRASVVAATNRAGTVISGDRDQASRR